MLYLQKLFFKIPVRRKVRNIADMNEFNWASLFRLFHASLTKNMVHLFLPL